MRVAMVTGSYPPQPCGIGDYAKRLVDELQGEGISVQVITTACGERSKCPEVAFTLENWKVKNWNNAAKWIAKQKFDLVHIQYPAKFYGYPPDLALLSLVLKWHAPKVPVIVTMHEFRIVHFLRKLTIVSIASRADAVVVTAESEKQSYARYMPWLKSRIHLIHLATTLPVVPTTLELRSAYRTKYHFSDTDIVVGYFGFLHPNKGIVRLLRAFAEMRKEVQGAKLLVMSLFDPANDPFHASLKEVVDELGCENDVIWTGYLTDTELSKHLGIVDFAVLPYAEGFSLRRLSLISAFEHALPLITTTGDVDPSTAGLRDGENVILVDADSSPTSLSKAMVRLASSSALRMKIGEAGRAWSTPFQWATVRKETLSLYQQLIDR